MSFNTLGINHFYTQILEENNILEPTPIQSLAIPIIQTGKHLIGQAQTGTGKTLAFLLPALQKINLEDNHVSTLVIAPTRELALQITEVARLFYDVSVLNIYGGQDFTGQLKALENHVDVIIATPGRLLHHLTRGRLDLSHVKTLIIDEADHLFKGGFTEDVQEIMTFLPQDKQILLFSATLDHTVTRFAKTYLPEHEKVKAPKKTIILDAITQMVIESSNRQKLNDLLTLFKRDFPTKTIIFCRSRIGVDSLYEELLKAGLSVEKLHGGLSQTVRETVMQGFRQDAFQTLVTTDVASRGLDINKVSHVINYNLPDLPEDYVHRIGRTGRAGYQGVAYTILTGKDATRLEKVEDYIGMKLPKLVLSNKNEDSGKNTERSQRPHRSKKLEKGRSHPSKTNEAGKHSKRKVKRQSNK